MHNGNSQKVERNRAYHYNNKPTKRALQTVIKNEKLRGYCIGAVCSKTFATGG